MLASNWQMIGYNTLHSHLPRYKQKTWASTLSMGVGIVFKFFFQTRSMIFWLNLLIKKNCANCQLAK